MTLDELEGIISDEVAGAIGYCGGDVARQRKDANDYYYGVKPEAPTLNGQLIDGRSRVTDSTVADTVEAILPSLMRTFAAGDRVAQFNAVGPEDEEAAEQETDFINHVVLQRNNGFEVFYTWFKDALTNKNGVVKWWAENAPYVSEETYEGLDEASFVKLTSDPEVEPIAHDMGQGLSGEPLHNVTVRCKGSRREVRIEVVPPEEFIISKDARRIADATFCGHRTRKTVSDLIAMGYDRAQVEKLAEAGGEDADLGDERRSRLSSSEEDDTTRSELNRSRRRVWVVEGYLRTDFDGDGIAELRRFVAAGDGANVELLKRKGWPDHSVYNGERAPFASITPLPRQHSFFGRSVAEQVIEIQKIRTALFRGVLDNTYAINNSRMEIPEAAEREGGETISDLMQFRPGGFVRTRMSGQLNPIVPAQIPSSTFAVLEFTEAMKENRTGVTRYNQGTDAESLNKTATGINAIMQQAGQRIELIARVFAETGVKDLFLGVHELILKNGFQAEKMRLRGKWVEIDPRQWKTRTDMTISVGLGHGSKETQVAMLSNLLRIQYEIVKLQGGIDGPMVNGPNIYSTLEKLTVASGQKNPEMFFTNPTEAQGQPQQPRPDPEMVKVQQQGEIEKAKLSLEAQKAQAEIALKAWEVQQGHALKQDEMATRADERSMAAMDRKAMQESQASKGPAVKVQFDAQEALDGVVGTLGGMAEQQTAAMTQMMAALQAAVQAIAAAAQQIAAPKRVLFDPKTGRPVGIESLAGPAHPTVQ